MYKHVRTSKGSLGPKAVAKPFITLTTWKQAQTTGIVLAN